MDQDLVGFVLALAFVACAGAVLLLMAEISRDTPQGGKILVAMPRPATCVPSSTRVTRQGVHRRSAGRHRR